MSLFELLSVEEKNGIDSYISDYAGEEGNTCSGTGDLSWVLRFWNENKERFSKMFKNNLILSKEICYQESKDKILHKMGASINGWSFEYRDFFYQWRKMIEEECGPCTYEWDTPNEQKRFCLNSLLDPESLANNCYSHDSFTIVDNNTGKEIVIAKGCKVMKAINKIVKAKNLNYNDFEKLRLEHSTILNQKTMKGHLCLSIHPLDFMTMSDNDCNWHSCMNWRDGGEYRQGTVEMMNSKFVVMAYLESIEHPFKIDNLDWSNKKWRQLFVVTPQIIMGIKPYPYYNADCELAALNWLRDLAEEANFGHYCDTIDSINNDDYSLLNDGRRLDFNFDMHHMYNDITDGHKAYVTTDDLSATEIYIMLSGETECMSCGKDLTNYYDEISPDDLLCSECEPHYRCSCCGDRIVGEDEIYWLDDEPYCSYCYDHCAVECPCCNEIHHSDRMEELYLTLDDENVAEDSPSVTICEECAHSSQIFGEKPKWMNYRRRYRYYLDTVLAVNPARFKDESAIEYFFPNSDDYTDFLAENSSDEE